LAAAAIAGCERPACGTGDTASTLRHGRGDSSVKMSKTLTTPM
jgi:hypothetical protein